MTYLQFYTGVVMALSEGQQLTFEMAKSKPRVRGPKHPHGSSGRLSQIESSRKSMAIRRLLAQNPHLGGGYDEETCNVSVPPTVQSNLATTVALSCSVCIVIVQAQSQSGRFHNVQETIMYM